MKTIDAVQDLLGSVDIAELKERRFYILALKDGTLPPRMLEAFQTKLADRVTEHFGEESAPSITILNGAFSLYEVKAKKSTEELMAEEATKVLTINGVKMPPTDMKSMSYGDVVRAADMTGMPTVVFHYYDGRSGSLTPGNRITLRDGMRFSVAHTGNA